MLRSYTKTLKAETLKAEMLNEAKWTSDIAGEAAPNCNVVSAFSDLIWITCSMGWEYTVIKFRFSSIVNLIYSKPYLSNV